MKTIILILLFIFVVSYWTEVSGFVSRNLGNIGQTTAQWLVDHTPKK